MKSNQHKDSSQKVSSAEAMKGGHKREAKAGGSFPVQAKRNQTGLPDNLKAGIENLSGYSMDDVKVHYNSSQPATLQAHAYAQGTDIHVAPSQERHLPHEAWHVVQQKQGRVKPTRQLKGKIPMNDDAGLEKEADTMGTRAATTHTGTGPQLLPNRTVQAHTLQLYSFEDFDSYSEAKNANKYSRAYLDEQKNDPIEDHFQKGFDNEQRDNIYRENIRYYEDENIVSDADGLLTLYKQKTELVPHIDHRFPKSRGGSNHYTNAAVLPAKANMKKSNKLELDEEPSMPLPAYKFLVFSSAFGGNKVGAFKEFSGEQRAAILEANTAHHDQGSPVSDVDGTTKLGRMDTTRVPHIDHITAKGEGGTNYYFNAQVLPANDNLYKSGEKGRRPDLENEVAEMSLVQYYKAKRKGQFGGRPAIEEDDVSSSSSENDDY